MGDDERAAALGKWEIQVRKGGLDMAVLAALWDEPLYGLELVRRLSGVTGMTMPGGTIYPLLSRLKAAGWVDSEWVDTDSIHPRKYYSLTEAGRRQVRGMAESWSAFADALRDLIAPIRGKT